MKAVGLWSRARVQLELVCTDQWGQSGFQCSLLRCLSGLHAPSTPSSSTAAGHGDLAARCPDLEQQISNQPNRSAASALCSHRALSNDTSSSSRSYSSVCQQQQPYDSTPTPAVSGLPLISNNSSNGPQQPLATAIGGLSVHQSQHWHTQWHAQWHTQHLKEQQHPQLQQLQQRRCFAAAAGGGGSGSSSGSSSGNSSGSSSSRGRSTKAQQQQQHTQDSAPSLRWLKEPVVAPDPFWSHLQAAREQQEAQQQQQQQQPQQRLQSRQGLQPQRVSQWLEQQWVEQQQQQLKPREFPIAALHLGAEIDMGGFQADHGSHFEEVYTSLPPLSNHTIFELKNASEDMDMLRSSSSSQHSQQEVVSYMVLYRYGSVIFINVDSDERQQYLSMLRPYLKLPQGKQQFDPDAVRSDETVVVVDGSLDKWSELKPDKVVVQTLDMGNLRVVSHVLSQSVALDYYNARVDEGIQHFIPYIKAVAESGKCDSVREKGLLALIATNSLLYTEVVTKIGLLDISQTAWKGGDKYYDLWDALRRDYEIKRRFEAINSKLGPMLENARFLLDVRAEQKSGWAEMVIIALITLEVVLNVAGHSLTWWRGQ